MLEIPSVVDTIFIVTMENADENLRKEGILCVTVCITYSVYIILR